MRKRISFFIFVFLMCTILSSCKTKFFPIQREIDEFELVQVIAIDKSTEDPSMVEVTFIIKSTQTSSASGEGGASEMTAISATGPTVFEAGRKIEADSGKIFFWGQVDYFIIGEAAAKEDFTKYFDFLIRGNEIRLSPKVYISEGCSAKELISETSAGNRFIVDRLKSIKYSISLMSNSDEVKIINILNMLDHTYMATIIPALSCEAINNETSTGEMPEKEIEISGYAVIKDFKLVGYIDTNCSRGYNFLTNKVQSSPINVQERSDLYVGLDVISVKTEAKFNFNGETLESVIYHTHVVSNIHEQQSRENIYTQSALENLSSKQSELIKAEMEQVIDLSKKYEIDCTELAQEVRMQHPLKWENLEDQWGELYPNLKIEVIVDSEIERTYDIREPNGYQMGS